MAAVRITYRDPDRTPDEVTLGAFAQIAAKRRFGLDAIKGGDPEVVLFGAFVELEGPQATKAKPDAFDEWLQGVEGFELPGDGEDPPPLAETSSDSSPDSPPTSE